jgi:hypothetical protein
MVVRRVGFNRFAVFDESGRRHGEYVLRSLAVAHNQRLEE